MTLPENVGVLGGGRMGAGIAHAMLAAGTTVTLVELGDELAHAANARVRASLSQGVERGTLSSEAAADAATRLRTTSAISALASAGLVIEAVPEIERMKLDSLRRIHQVAPSAWIATNTSSIPIHRLAAAVGDPGRFGGLHFFNPVPVSSLVEIVRGPETDDEFVELASEWIADLGRRSIVVADSPGFATTRLGLLLGLEAMRMLEEGVATAADIDTAMVLGYRHPVGPLRTTDLVGLDVRLDIATALHAELGERFAPPRILKDLVAAGALGRKSGRGFFDYDDRSAST